MYTLLPTGDRDEAKGRVAAEDADVVGVVVMRPVRIDKPLSSTPVTYSGQMYGGFCGGYYGYGWVSPWGAGGVSGGEIRTDTILTVETLVYARRENKLLWAGQSKTTNPKNVNRVIEDTAENVANELEQIGLMARSH